MATSKKHNDLANAANAGDADATKTEIAMSNPGAPDKAVDDLAAKVSPDKASADANAARAESDAAAAAADVAAARSPAAHKSLADSAPQPAAAQGPARIQQPSVGRAIHVRTKHPARGEQTVLAFVTMATTGYAKVNARPLIDGSNQEGVETHFYSIPYNADGKLVGPNNDQPSWRYPPHVKGEVDADS